MLNRGGVKIFNWAKHFYSILTHFLLIGPDKWHKDFPVAKEGKRQSPIDLTTDAEVEKDLTTAPLSWRYLPEANVNIENTGASWKVNVQSKQESCKNEYDI